mmetsp:Transcript_14631/g.44196  ORF Transcript_14631/g.44196 Transcript_14631/m.44196 type:complete len:750 (+) Transcript_14631:360-2609(+)
MPALAPGACGLQPALGASSMSAAKSRRMLLCSAVSRGCSAGVLQTKPSILKRSVVLFLQPRLKRLSTRRCVASAVDQQVAVEPREQRRADLQAPGNGATSAQSDKRPLSSSWKQQQPVQLKPKLKPASDLSTSSGSSGAKPSPPLPLPEQPVERSANANLSIDDSQHSSSSGSREAAGDEASAAFVAPLRRPNRENGRTPDSNIVQAPPNSPAPDPMNGPARSTGPQQLPSRPSSVPKRQVAQRFVAPYTPAPKPAPGGLRRPALPRTPTREVKQRHPLPIKHYQVWLQDGVVGRKKLRAAITACTSWEEVAAIVDTQEMHDIAVAYALAHLVKLHKKAGAASTIAQEIRQRGVLERMTFYAVELLRSNEPFYAYSIQACLSAFAKLDYNPGKAALALFSTRMKTSLDSFTAGDAANTVRALAGLNYVPENDILADFAQVVVEEGADQLISYNVGSLAWGYATLGVHPGNALLQIMEIRIARWPEDFVKGPHLAETLWGLGTLGILPSVEVMEALLHRVTNNPREKEAFQFKGPTAAMALSGIAKLAQHDQAAWDPEALVEAVAVLDAALVKHAASLNTAQLAQALRALASLGRVKSKALGPLCQAIAHQEEVPAKHVCKMLHAFQTLTVPSAALPPAIQDPQDQAEEREAEVGAEVEDGQSAAQIALRALALKVRGNVKRFLPQEVMEALYSFDALARPTPSGRAAFVPPPDVVQALATTMEKRSQDFSFLQKSEAEDIIGRLLYGGQ